MGRFHGHDLLKGFGMNAAPGWIEDDEIRLIDKVTQFYKDITGDEAAVIEIIGPGIGWLPTASSIISMLITLWARGLMIWAMVPVPQYRSSTKPGIDQQNLVLWCIVSPRLSC